MEECIPPVEPASTGYVLYAGLLGIHLNYSCNNSYRCVWSKPPKTLQPFETLIEYHEHMIEYYEHMIESHEPMMEYHEPMIEYHEPKIEYHEPMIDYHEPML